MYEEKIAVITSTILFVCAVVFTLGMFIAPYVTKKIMRTKAILIDMKAQYHIPLPHNTETTLVMA